MKVKIIVSLYFVLYSNGLANPAQCQEVLNEPNVPANVRKHFFKGEEEIQVLPGPVHVIDLRKGESINNMTVVVGPAPTAKVTNTVIKLPEENALPGSIFQSNIPTNNHLPKLPPGQIYRVLAPTHNLKPGDLIGKPSLGVKATKLGTVENRTPEPNILKYNQTDQGLNRPLNVKTDVYGKLKTRPGDLLRNH